MVRQEISFEQLCEWFPHHPAAVFTTLQNQAVQALLQDSLRFINHRHCYCFPLLQPSLGFAWGLQFLAIGHLFPCRNVLCSEKYSALDIKMDIASSLQYCMLACEHVCFNWIHWRALQWEIEVNWYLLLLKLWYICKNWRGRTVLWAWWWD